MIKGLLIVSVIGVVYTYAGYPLLLFVWRSLAARRGKPVSSGRRPSVSILIPAYNEEDCIAETVSSILKADGADKNMEILVVSDASTDRTDQIVDGFHDKRVRLIRQPMRSGKAAAHAAALAVAKGDVLVLIDASSRFRNNTLVLLLQGFADPRVGSVVGSKRIIPTGTSVAKGDGLYWRYDSLLRSLESQTGSSWVGCEGGVYAIRRSLFNLNYPGDIAQDYAVCCEVFKQGYLNRYEPSAIVDETASQTMEAEFRRKVRVIVRGIKAFFAYAYLLNPFKAPGFFVQNMSHRLMRWVVPFLLVAILFLSSGAFFAIQAVFYGLALAGLLLRKISRVPWVLSVPLYFTTVNLAALVAWGQLFRKYDVWERTSRETIPNRRPLDKNVSMRSYARKVS